MQIDGIHSDAGAERKSVMVMAATNCPWDLDEALRRQAAVHCLPSQCLAHRSACSAALGSAGMHRLPLVALSDATCGSMHVHSRCMLLPFAAHTVPLEAWLQLHTATKPAPFGQHVGPAAAQRGASCACLQHLCDGTARSCVCRRLEKRIYIPLPEKASRAKLLELSMKVGFTCPHDILAWLQLAPSPQATAAVAG